MFQSFLCVLLIVCCIVFASIVVKLFSFNPGAIFFIALYMMFLLLLKIQCHLHIAGQLYSQLCFVLFCAVIVVMKVFNGR